MTSFHERFRDRIDFFHGTVVLDESTFKAIQEEAWGQGMTDAAEMTVDTHQHRMDLKASILKARDAQSIQNKSAS